MADSNKQTIFLFTENFPFGSGESFLENEIKFASESVNIYIFPRCAYNKDTYVRKVPDNVKIINLIHEEKELSGKTQLFKKLFFNLRVIAMEIFKSGKPWVVIRKSRELNATLIKAHNLSQLIETFRISNRISNPIYYSYWMNEWALALSVSKDRSFLTDFCFRILGYDIYDERYPGDYLPFRYYNYSRCKRVFAVSKHTMNYAKSKNMFPEKITWSYLGTTDYGLNPELINPEFTLLSCSRLIPLKRVHLIPQILQHVNGNIKWIHIGSGPELENVQQLANSLPPNIHVDLIPHFEDYSGLVNFYLSTHIDLFLHVSESEGLGVVQLEAMSFGIPVFTTKVGGAAEYINNHNGVLLDVDFSPIEVAKQISTFMQNQEINSQYRLKVKEYWKANFEDKKIYSEFYNQLTS